MRRFFISLLLFSATLALHAQTDSIALWGNLDEIVVSSVRLQTETPLVTQEYKQDLLQQQNTGVNLPYLLTTTPSLIATSDDGLGVGYTYFRVRGTDQSRINMTINSVPLNDNESQTVFWVNLTDMLSSMGSVNVQRGVGTSTNGAAAFGASINMQTETPETQPYAELLFNGGMYNTFRECVKAGTGLMNNGFAFDARFSKVNSDGYLERANSDLYSYYASGAWYGESTLVKLLVFGGHEKTYMAWDGVSAEQLTENRRYNPAGHYTDDNGNDAFYENQNDIYGQQHVQLHASHQFTPKWDLVATLHYTHGNGYYDQYKESAKLTNYGLSTFTDTLGNLVKRSDLTRKKNMNNHFYGGVLSVSYHNAKVHTTLGGAVNNYNGDHWGNVTWLRNYLNYVPYNYEYYRNEGDKLDANVYWKAKWTIVSGLNVFGDLQYRHVDYRIAGINDEDCAPITIHEKFDFFNPKAGISYAKDGHNIDATFAIANREPSRKNYTECGPNDIPQSERLYDYELGYQFSHRIFSVGLNLYWMNYDNQLVLTGEYSDTGAYLTKNVKKSYRAGLEFLIGVHPCEWFTWDGNLTLSRNKIKNYTDWVDVYDADGEWLRQDQIAYGTVDIAFAPNITAMSNFQFNYKGFDATLQTNYVGKQYLDNTNNSDAMLKQYCVSNLHLAYTIPIKKVIKKLTINVQMNNLFNTKYVSNGGNYNSMAEDGTRYCSPWYYAQAGFNIHAGFDIKF